MPSDKHARDAAGLNRDRLIALAEVIQIVGLGKTSIYAMIRKGKFPQKVKLCSASRWVEREVLDWLQSQIDSR